MGNEIEIRVGRTYIAKRPRGIGLFPRLRDDRQVKWLGIDQVQYDSPSVKNGRKFPIVSLSAFLKWAARDVTDELPEGEWAEYTTTTPTTAKGE